MEVETINQAARSLLPSFAALVEDNVRATVPSADELADAPAGELYFPSGVVLHFPAPAAPLKLSLSCPDAAADALLRAVRENVRHLAASPASRTAVARSDGRPLRQVFAATSLLRERLEGGRVGAAARKVSEARLLALRLARRPMAELLAESERLVQSAPAFAPSRLQRAETLLAAGRAEDAVAQTWIGALVLPGAEELQPAAVALLAKCQTSVGVAGVRLDVAVLDDGDGSRAPSLGPLDWSQLTSAQRDRHDAIVANIPPADAVAADPRQTRLAVLSTTPHIKLQRFFSWIVPHRLAVSSTPRSRDDVLGASALGVTVIVTLTMEEPLPAPWFDRLPVRNVSIPVKNMHPPTVNQVDAIVAEILAANAAGGQALVHCGGGKGRAGTVAAAYVMLFGQRGHPPLCGACRGKHRAGERARMTVGSCAADGECGLGRQEPAMTAGNAMQLIRAVRPGSIESERQERFLHDYGVELWRRACAEEAGDSRPTAGELRALSATGTPLRVIGAMPPDFPRLIVLCGLPGGGKSHLAARILATAPDGSAVACQDVLNTREACERLVAATTRAASSRACAIVDRVNAAPAARRGWLSAAFRPASAVVVHVATGAAAAASRAAGRVDHPTLAPTTAASVVRAVARSFVAPGAAEVAAGFSAVLVVDGDDGADEAVALLRARGRGRRRRPDPAAAAGAGAAVPAAATPPTRMEGIVKFPRTRHLLNLGGTGVTRDDLVLSRRDAEALVSLLRAQTTSTTLTVEEKVDGANVGFSLDADTGAIRAQNRSHYVDAGSHAQFRTLRAYINAKRAGLRRALSGGRVLYGEWMYARHSIRYTRLPSHFLAFDIWDAAAGRFLSRARFRAALAGSGIAMVPEVAVPRPATLDGLRAAAVGTASVLCDDGPVEGVVVRVDARDWMVERVKIVRPDFIVGNEHWSRAPLERNVIVGDGAAELYS